MRRLVFSIIVASGLVLIGAGSASAEPTPTAGVATAVPGKKVCKIADSKLDELSGLVATQDGFITINDSTFTASHKRIFFLDTDCKITKQVRFSGDGPRDTEGMALSPDGKTLWIADIGDNERERSTIGLWKMAVGSTKEPVLYRMSYPQGDGPFDAEGLMINGDGTPIVVTKEANKVSLFMPTAVLKAGSASGVPMKRAADLKLPASSTENPLGPLGRLVATDAAVSPDRSKVVIRTYADAFEWPVTGGDLLAAVKGTPVQTPLPNEPQGEAITYSADGKSFYTVSDMQGKPGSTANYILRYTPAVKPPVTKAAAGSSSGGAAAGNTSFFSNLSLDDITYLVGGVGVFGAILVGFGIFGIMRHRRRSPLDPADLTGGSGPGPKPIDAATELLAVGGAGAGAAAGVYGRGPQPGTYGGRPGAPGAPGGPGGPGGVRGRPAGAGPTPAGAPKRGGGVYGGVPAGGRPIPGGAQPPVRPGPGGAQPPARSGPGAVQPPVRSGPGGAQSPARPGPGGGQPAGRPGGGQAGRPGQPGGGQPPARGGVYGAPPSPPPPGRSGQGGPAQHPSGFYGQGAGHPDNGRQAAGGYADLNGTSRGFDNPGHGRAPRGR